MGHPVILNETPFVVEPLVLADKDLAPILVTVLKASFRLRDSSEGPLVPMRAQLSFDAEGSWYGDPASSSPRTDPEGGPPKPATDVILLATTRPPSPTETRFDVGLRIGRHVQRAVVFGERVWEQGPDGLAPSAAQPASAIPLRYEFAFGGIDQEAARAGDPRASFAGNPVGIGFHLPDAIERAGARLPLIEHPERLIKSWHDAPEPVGFGVIAPNWTPRASRAGTYDERWEATRRPALPDDFDPVFMNAASAGLVLGERLAGEEKVRIVNASRRERLDFRLPGLPSPKLAVLLRSGRQVASELVLDTVVIDTDDEIVTLLYRASIALDQGAHDLVNLRVSLPGYRDGPGPRVASP